MGVEDFSVTLPQFAKRYPKHLFCKDLLSRAVHTAETTTSIWSAHLSHTTAHRVHISVEIPNHRCARGCDKDEICMSDTSQFLSAGLLKLTSADGLPVSEREGGAVEITRDLDLPPSMNRDLIPRDVLSHAVHLTGIIRSGHTRGGWGVGSSARGIDS
ncbi:hypothetical protein CDAR_77931 [Caerostris darwini]|uniref:Uncharacterized protein n=1 Tax=Caerostris darwini TaxID=1538125 RepID=A0AAV4NEQ8_9ARAC|nr:hypothetical protein CDAR_77931 [Caerostris darwini]